jgi:hypothetical protein
MAEAGLYIGWSAPARGREKAALELFNETLQYYGRLQQQGKIERFDVAVMTPTGGEAGGCILIRGTAQQIDSLRRDDEYTELMTRVQMHADGLRIADAYVDESLAAQITRFEKAVGQLG